MCVRVSPHAPPVQASANLRRRDIEECLPLLFLLLSSFPLLPSVFLPMFFVTQSLFLTFPHSPLPPSSFFFTHPTTFSLTPPFICLTCVLSPLKCWKTKEKIPPGGQRTLNFNSRDYLITTRYLFRCRARLIRPDPSEERENVFAHDVMPNNKRGSNHEELKLFPFSLSLPHFQFAVAADVCDKRGGAHERNLISETKKPELVRKQQ